MKTSEKITSYKGVAINKEDQGFLAGYSYLIEEYDLAIPLQYPISLVSDKNRRKVTETYKLYPKSYKPTNELYSQLTFALKYEGINLLVLKFLFLKIDPSIIVDIVEAQPISQYSRKVWYLYEWLMNIKLELPDAATRINYVQLADDKIQYTIEHNNKSERHRVNNNLLGTKGFCPHVYKTEKLKQYTDKQLHISENQFPHSISKKIILRANAYLLLEDSKSSFAIEGEKPKAKKLERWGAAIKQAGQNELNEEEFLRLQQLVLPSKHSITLGYRTEGGFIGDYDKDTFEPLPAHISAKHQDLEILMGGLIESCKKLNENKIDAVIASAIISFGFVFIHPLIDGNGRIHRCLIHHILARKKFSPQGIIFPVSASIHEKMIDYKNTLEKYSSSLLEFIVWETTLDKNVSVTNDTIDYYRYFDATHLAEFLYECVWDTIDNIIPHEIKMIQNYDSFKESIEEKLGLPDNDINLLSKFLIQNNGSLSKRKKVKFLDFLSDTDVKLIEDIYKEIYME